MVRGRITPAREAVVPVAVRGPGGRRIETEATIDTGFTGDLTLPPHLISELELPLAESTVATLADGRTASLDWFVASVEWHGETREAAVILAVGGVLVGMGILEGSRVTLDVIDGGAVTIRRL
jgi:clan AA aspartic protease